MFVERLKSLRAEKGISQSALSDYMGLTQQAIAKWEIEKAASVKRQPAAIMQMRGCN